MGGIAAQASPRRRRTDRPLDGSAAAGSAGIYRPLSEYLRMAPTTESRRHPTMGQRSLRARARCVRHHWASRPRSECHGVRSACPQARPENQRRPDTFRAASQRSSPPASQTLAAHSGPSIETRAAPRAIGRGGSGGVFVGDAVAGTISFEHPSPRPDLTDRPVPKPRKSCKCRASRF